MNRGEYFCQIYGTTSNIKDKVLHQPCFPKYYIVDIYRKYDFRQITDRVEEDPYNISSLWIRTE